MKKLLTLIIVSLTFTQVFSQVISVTGIGVTGRFNSCNGSNLPTVTANLISTSGGASVSGGLFTCLNPCDSSTIRVTISNAKWNKSPNNEWLHGLFLPASAGFSVSPITIPAGFLTYNTGCVGTCPSGSGINGGPGFYFDNSNGSTCCGNVTANDGLPCNNYGDATMSCNAALSLTFDLTFCNSIIITSSHQFIVTGSSDGETGCWNFNDGLPHKITFTIPTVPCTPANINPVATIPVRTCVGNVVNYTSTLTGTCNANSIHWWDAPTGGNLVGTGSPFVYDPAGPACPGGTTLYATCCSGTNTVCVPRIPVTIPGSCNPLIITSATSTNTLCGVLGSINSVSVANAIGTVSYSLNPGAIINNTGVFTGLNQASYTITAGDATGCTVTTQITIQQPLPITFSSPSISNVTCALPNAGQIIISANGGAGTLSYSINPAAVQTTPGTFIGLSAQSYIITATDITNCTATTVVNLAAPVLPVWGTVTGINISCNGMNNGSINAIATGGSGVLTYTLQPSGTVNNSGIFNGLAGAIYTIEVSDANGCSLTTNLTIIDPPVLNWTSVLVNGASCSYLNDGSVNAQASGGTSVILYQLLPSGTSNNTGVFAGLSAGNYTIKASDANNCSVTSLLTIIPPPPIVFGSPVIIIPLCQGGNNGSLNITATGGSGTISYSINPGGTTNSIGSFINLAAGNYTITATDNNICSQTIVITISQPSPLVFTSAAMTNPLCNAGTNGTVNVSATGGTGVITYTLLPSGTSNTTGNFTALSAMSYTILATDANGCSVSTVMLMTQPTPLVWSNSTTTNVSCNGGGNGAITSIASGGTGAISYTLQPGSFTNATGSFSSLSSGSYTVTASDVNGCTTSTIIGINQPTQLIWSSTNSTNVNCFGGSDGNINVTASGGTGIISYTILPSGNTNTNGSFNGLNASTYTVKATDANGCSITSVFNIIQPSALFINTITNTIPSCIPGNDAVLTIIASGGTPSYSYSSGGTFQFGNVFTGMGTGTYTVTIKDAHNCTVTSVYTIIAPDAPVITSSTSTNVICYGGNNASIHVVANGGTGLINYTLQPGGVTNTNGNFTSLTANTYTISASDALGCSVSTTVIITQPTAINWVSTTATNVSCYGGTNGSISVSASGGTGTKTYTLQPGSVSNATGNYSSLSTGSYTITASDANGCSISTIMTVNQPTQLVWSSTSNINVNCFGGSDGSMNAIASGGTGIITYTILPSGTSNTSGSFNGHNANTYTINATDANGCSISTTVIITQPAALLITSITNTIPSCIPGNDASITISVNGGTPSYTYSIGGSSQSGNVFAGLGGGIYTITVSDAHNCTVTSTQTIIVPNAPVITSSTGTNVSCYGGNNASIHVVSNGGTGLINYTLQPGAVTNTNGNFTSLTANTYTISASDALGCSVSTTVIITQPTAVNWVSTIATNVSCFGGTNGSISVSASGGTGTKTYTLQSGSLSNTTGIYSSLSTGNYTITASDANGCSISTIVTVNQPTQLVWLSTSSINVNCFGNSDGSINTLASGGTGIITYTILPSGITNTNGSFNGLNANTYAINATDANGCSISTAVIITQPAALVITSILNTIPSCVPGNDASITISANGGTPSYTYSIGGSSQIGNVFAGLGGGIYTITVSDSHNCTVTSTQAITIPNAPIITSATSSNVSCYGGSNASIHVLASGGTGLISYTLQPGGITNTNGNFTSLTANNYTITVSDIIGCAVSTTVIITQPTLVSWLSTTAANVSCYGGTNGSISVSASGGTGTKTYTLQSGSLSNTTGIYSSLSTGNYTITASDANGCSISTIMTVNQPTQLIWSSMSSINVNCFGGSSGSMNAIASGGTGIITYTIQPSGLSNTNGSFNGLNANTYTINAADANGCSISTTVIITQPVALLITSISNTIPSCVPGNDASITISASGGTMNYSYSIGAITQANAVFSNIGAGVYTITVTDAHGCTVSSVQSVVTPNAPSVLSVSTTNASCVPGNDASVTINATGGTGAYTYAANALPYQNSNLFTGLAAGTYTIIVKDASACTGSSIVTLLSQNAPVVNSVSTTMASCVPGCDATAIVSASGSVSSVFSYSLDALTFQTSPAFNSLCAGMYTVTVKDGNGCTATFVFPITTVNAPIISSALSINELCHGGNNASISVQSTGGSGNITYTLQPTGLQNNTGTFSSLSANTYTVMVSDVNGCTAMTILPVTEPALLQFNNVTSTATLCSGVANGTLNAPVSGGTGSISYSINPSAVFVSPASFTNLNGNTTYTIIASDANNCSVSTSVFITQAIPISILNMAHTNVSCHAAQDGNLQVTAGGGTGALTYTLQPGSLVNNTGFFSGLGGAIYTITISDANNCTVSTLQTITEPPAISLLSSVSTNISCHDLNDGSIAISCIGGIGSLTYTLQPGFVVNTSGSFNALSSNTYTVKVTDATNCSYTTTAVIMNPSPLSFNTVTSTNVLCNGNSDGTISASVIGGTGAYTYSIAPFPVTNSTGLFNALGAGLYTVTASDINLCSITTTVSISQPAAMISSLLSTQDVTCYGGLNGACSVSVSGGLSPYQYQLLPVSVQNNSGFFTGMTAGIYSVQIKDSNQCVSTVAPILINQPPQIIWTAVTHQDILCFGDINGIITCQASGGTGSITYNVTPVAGTQTSSGTFANLPANTYTIMATDASACTKSSVVVILQPLPISFTRIDLKKPTCHGDADGSILADAVGGTSPFSFQLNGGPSVTTAFFTNLTTGAYTISATDAAGCKKDTVLFLNEPDLLAADVIDISPATCKDVNDGKITIYGTGGTGTLTYYLYPVFQFNKTGVYNNLAPGPYSLTIKDSLGCKFDTTLNVLLTDPMSFIITKEDLGCTGTGTEGWAEISVTGGEAPYSYTWNTDPPQYTASIHDLYFGFYVVNVADVNGCAKKDTVYIAPGTCCEQVFIPNAFSPNGDGVNDVFKVTTTAGIELLQFAVYDRWGNKVWSSHDYKGSWDGTYKKLEATLGTYFYIFSYKCLTDGQKYMHKGDLLLIR